MLAPLLAEFFERDLTKLKSEINLYPDEKTIWLIPEGISNSAGTLCLHLSGNLLYFIGAGLGKSGYMRDRDKEFILRDIPRKELLNQIDQSIAAIKSNLPSISDQEMPKDFPLEKNGKILTTQHMLIHLLAHLAYHLGQVNYHRRLSQKL